DEIHVIYFVGEALWTYLNTPFLYTQDGFATKEIAPIEVEGEIWRRLQVTFPDRIKSHTRTQISCFGPTGCSAVMTIPSTSSAARPGSTTPPSTATSAGSSFPRGGASMRSRATISRSGIRSSSGSTWARSRSPERPSGAKRMSAQILFRPMQLGAIELGNRIVMAPMTRMRAGPGHAPTALNAEYYAQRASAGLIITEGVAVSPQGQGFPNAPGVYTADQIAGWRSVSEAVHARGGKIVMQIAHNGRNSHSSLLPDGVLPVAPSAISPNIPAFTRDFQPVQPEVPRALDAEELPGVVSSFRQAASNAIAAGFDGVELQGANSHLIEQFLENGANHRADAYGGSKENRAR